jgi:hypothetical protein
MSKNIVMLTPRLVPSSTGVLVDGHTNSVICLADGLAGSHNVYILSGTPVGYRQNLAANG